MRRNLPRALLPGPIGIIDFAPARDFTASSANAAPIFLRYTPGRCASDKITCCSVCIRPLQFRIHSCNLAERYSGVPTRCFPRCSNAYILLGKQLLFRFRTFLPLPSLTSSRLASKWYNWRADRRIRTGRFHDYRLSLVKKTQREMKNKILLKIVKLVHFKFQISILPLISSFKFIHLFVLSVLLILFSIMKGIMNVG